MKDKWKIGIGLMLCLMGIVVLIYVFPMIKLLIFIPIFLFVISIFIKRNSLSRKFPLVFMLKHPVFTNDILYRLEKCNSPPD